MTPIPATAVFGVVIGCTCAILIFLMLINLVRKEYSCSKHGDHNYRMLFFMNTFMFGSYLIFCIYATIESTYSVISTYNGSFYVPWCSTRLYEMIPYIIAKIVLYQFYLYRFHLVFTNSLHSISTNKLKLLGVLVSIPILLLTVVSLSISIKPAIYLSNTNNSSEWKEMNISNYNDCRTITNQYATTVDLILQLIATLLYILNEIIFSIIVLRLFLSRILLLTLNINQNQNKNKNKSISNLDQLKAGKNVAIKTTNLIILSVATNHIIFIKYIFNLDSSIFVIDALCNCLAIYLSYKFSSSLYDLLFKCCHKECHKLCIKLCICCCLPKGSNEIDKISGNISRIQLASIGKGNKNGITVDTTTSGATTTSDTTPDVVPRLNQDVTKLNNDLTISGSVHID